MKKSSIRQDVEDAREKEIARNTQMFHDADRLDEAAYKVIEFGMTGDDIWERFSKAKALADAKRTAAYQDWIRIKRQPLD